MEAGLIGYITAHKRSHKRANCSLTLTGIPKGTVVELAVLSYTEPDKCICHLSGRSNCNYVEVTMSGEVRRMCRYGFSPKYVYKTTADDIVVELLVVDLTVKVNFNISYRGKFN